MAKKKSVAFKMPNQTSVYIPDNVYTKILYWMGRSSPDECSGMGSIIYNEEERRWEVEDCWLVKQDNTGSTTEMDAQALNELHIDHFNLKKEGKVQGELLWWWHSHVNMDVFWSGTDLDAIAQLGEYGQVVSTVFNLKGESLSSYYRNTNMPLFLPEIPTIIEPADTVVFPFDYFKDAAESIGFVLDDSSRAQKLLKELGECFALERPDQDDWESEWKEKAEQTPKKGALSSYLGSVWDDWENSETIKPLYSLTNEEIIEEMYEDLSLYPGYTFDTIKWHYKDIPEDRLRSIIKTDEYLAEILLGISTLDYSKIGGK